MDFDHIRQFSPQILQLAKKHGILRVFVFGSTARGETTPKSDLDLLVELEEGVSLFNMAGFGYEVEKLLHTRVDVVPVGLLSSLKDQEFVKNIRQEAIAL